MGYTEAVGQPRLLLVLVAISLLAVAWIQAPRLLDQFQVDEDFRAFYWMNRFRDDDLFESDPLISQIGCRRYQTLSVFGQELTVYFNSLGYSLLFLALGHFLSPILLSKLIPFALLSLTTCYLFKYGQSLRNQRAGIALAIGFAFLNLASPTSVSVASGLPRAFACPLMIALLYYVHHQNHVGPFLVSTLSALIYPPVFPLALLTWGLSLFGVRLAPRIKVSIGSRDLLPLLMAFLMGLLVLAPVLVPQVSRALDASSDSASRDERIWEDPRYRAGGRQPLFETYPVVGRGGLVTKRVSGLHLLILVGFSCLVVAIRGTRILVPKEPLWLLTASLILFVLAWVGIWLTDSLILYLPSRYTRASLLVFFSMLLFINSPDSIKEASRALSKQKQSNLWWLACVEAVLVGLVFLVPSSRGTFGIDVRIPLGIMGLLLGLLILLYAQRSSHQCSTDRAMGRRTKNILTGVLLVILVSLWGVYARVINHSLDPSQERRDLLRFVETLPKDALLAGYPCALDEIPLFAKRQILFGCENYNTSEKLTRDALAAYYASEESIVSGFCARYDVDYLVVDRRTYSQEYLAEGWIYYEPYNTELLDQIGSQETFFLEQLPDAAKVFQSGEYYVVSCDARIFLD
jgi:hypothetical protein